MKKYILTRAIKVVFTVWFVWSLIFLLTRFSGDPVEWIFADMDTTEAMINTLKESLGLDLPKLPLASEPSSELGEGQWE